MQAPQSNLVVLVMGVSGSGKSTVASELAKRIGAVFVEGDDFHPPSNREKLRAGVALTDEDRAGWLASLRQEVERRPTQRVLLACSALKHAYRRALLGGLGRPYAIVFLWGSEELLSERAALNGRTGTPTHWAITGPTTISLYPAATGAGTLTVRYHRVPPTLTAGSDVPILPEMYHELLVIGAAMLMASRERQSAAYGDMQTEYNELSRAFRAQTGIAQQQTPRTIGRSGLL